VNEPTTQVQTELSRARIEQRFRTNSGLIIATRVITLALSLVTIPVLVSRLGVSGYGIWEALFAFASLAAMFQVPITGTLVWRISEAYGQGNAAEIRRLVRLGMGVRLSLFVALWPLAWTMREPIVTFLGVAPETRGLAAEIFPIVAGLILLTGVSETVEAVVSGCQRTGLVNVVTAVAQTLNYAVVIVLVTLGAGLWSLAAGQAVGTAARLIGAWITARLSFGSFSLLPLAPGRADVSMLRYSGLMMVGSGAAALRDQTDKIILASLASPLWVGYYGIAARLSALVMEIISFFYVPILTAVGALNGMGDWEGVRRLYTRTMATVSIVTGLVVVVVAGLSDQLVVLWFGDRIPEVTMLLWLLITGSAAAAMLTGPGTAICRGAGRVGIETTYLMFNLVLNVLLTIALVVVIGPIGTAVATGTTWAASSVLFLFVLHRNVDLPTGASRRALATALVAAGTTVAVNWTSRALGLPTGREEAFLSLMVLGTVSALLYLGLLMSSGVVSPRDASAVVRSALRRGSSGTIRC
jgi:O-antigen/teichoic acid export membrane protein